MWCSHFESSNQLQHHVNAYINLFAVSLHKMEHLVFSAEHCSFFVNDKSGLLHQPLSFLFISLPFILLCLSLASSFSPPTANPHTSWSFSFTLFFSLFSISHSYSHVAFGSLALFILSLSSFSHTHTHSLSGLFLLSLHSLILSCSLIFLLGIA